MDAHLSLPTPIGDDAVKNTVLHVFYQPIKAPNAFSIYMHPYLFDVLRSAFTDVLPVDIGVKTSTSRDEK